MPIDAAKADLGLTTLKHVQTVELFRAAPDAGTYSHHGHLARLGDDAVVATWSNHKVDEDCPGQRVLFAISRDDGKTWTAPAELLPPTDEVLPETRDGKGHRTMCANGFATVDGTLYAIGECWRDGGWNRDPQSAGVGRLTREIKPDGTLGEPFWLEAAPPAASHLPTFPGADDPRLTARCAQLRAALLKPNDVPQWDFKYFTTDFENRDGHKMCEPTYAWRLSDGRWAKLYRDLNKTYRQFAAYSSDDGATWSDPVETDFPDGNARTASVQLPDGAVIVVNNPRPGFVGGFADRDPLVISIATDGLTFDRAAVLLAGAPPQRFKGRWKGPGFQYPNALVVDASLLVIYSINKEDMAVARISVAELRAQLDLSRR